MRCERSGSGHRWFVTAEDTPSDSIRILKVDAETPCLWQLQLLPPSLLRSAMPVGRALKQRLDLVVAARRLQMACNTRWRTDTSSLKGSTCSLQSPKVCNVQALRCTASRDPSGLRSYESSLQREGTHKRIFPGAMLAMALGCGHARKRSMSEALRKRPMSTQKKCDVANRSSLAACLCRHRNHHRSCNAPFRRQLCAVFRCGSFTQDAKSRARQLREVC